MQRLFLPVIALAIVAACGFTSIAVAQSDILKSDARLALELEHERQAAQLAQQRAEQQRPFWAAIAVIGSGLGLGMLGLWAYNWHADRAVQRRRIAPDASGRYAIPDPQTFSKDVAAHLAAMLTAGQMQAQIEAAKTPQPVPSSITYAPKIDVKPAFAQIPTTAPALIDAQAGPAPAEVPSFAQLLDRGAIHRGAPLILGYTKGQPLHGSWRDLYSSAVAGVSGSGKTTTIRFLACQSALHGARFVVVDPHADTGEDSLAATLEPLQHAMLCEPAGNDRDILQAVRLVRSRLDARLHGHKERSPLVMCVDEFTRCMRSSTIADELAGLIEAIGQEGRKVGVFALLAGQIWTAERAGGTPLRDALASCYVHRIKRRQANFLLQLGEELPETLTLPTGAAYLYRTTGEIEEVRVPLTTAADVQHVASLLQPLPAARYATTIDIEPEPIRSEAIAALAVGDSTPLPAHSKALDARSERVRELVRAGTSQKDILRDVWGLEATGGSAYTKAAAELRQVLAELV